MAQVSDWLPRICVLALFLGVLAVPLAWRPPASVAAAGALKLVVITPHNEQIRHEVGRAFADWHRREHGGEVVIDWRSLGGTSDIERQLLSEYAFLAEQGNMDAGAGYDLVFGGGDYFFDSILKRGVKGHGSVLGAVDLSPSEIRDIYPRAEIAGKKLYDRDGQWWGVVLSSFGIVYNRDVLDLLDLPEPKTWSDLADPRLAGWVALADPGHSGSVKVTYEAIVQRYGWDKGWKTLRRAFANARYFASGSNKVPLDVSAGEAAAGMCIDFYGRYQSQVVGASRLDGRRPRVGYVAPAAATTVTADPVALLRGARQRELGIRFIRFLLSRPGQGIWNLPVGASADGLKGPERFVLRRAPIRRDLYATHLAHMVDQVDPYEIARALPPGTPSYFRVITPVLHAMAIDVHHDLKLAWRTIAAEKDAVRRGQMLNLFDALPFTPQQLLQRPAIWKAQRGSQDRDRLRWTEFFRERYRKIAALGSG